MEKVAGLAETGIRFPLQSNSTKPAPTLIFRILRINYRISPFIRLIRWAV